MRHKLIISLVISLSLLGHGFVWSWMNKNYSQAQPAASPIKEREERKLEKPHPFQAIPPSMKKRKPLIVA